MDRPVASEVADAVRTRKDEASKQKAVNELVRQLGVTLTETLTEPDRNTKVRLMRALTGYQYDGSSTREIYTGKPGLPTVRLRSLLSRCPACKADGKGECGRKPGEFHSITYKTMLVEGDANDLTRIYNRDGTIDEFATCEVDPKTGHFLEPLPIGEAIKVLRKFGVGIVHARKKHEGIVEEIAYVEKYGPTKNDDDKPRRPTRATVVR